MFATGAASIVTGLSASSAAAAPVPAQSITFHCSVLPQTFDVPVGVTSVAYTAEAGAGGKGGAGSPGDGGNGDVSTGSITVQPGQALTIVVGCSGQAAGPGGPGDGGSGYADGGDGGQTDPSSNPGGGGGGATAILRQNVPLVVVGGGGGGGATGFLGSYTGGNGGSRTNPNGGGGQGPGAGAGSACCAQTVGSGGEGGRGVAWGGAGGGGGGGFAGGFGGGGGGLGAGGGGGGGRGSTHADPAAVTLGNAGAVAGTGAGYVTLTVANADAGSLPVVARCNKGIVQSYTAPNGATAISVTAIGATGASQIDVSGGAGAGIDAEVAVHSGQTIFYAVGCHGVSAPGDGQNGGYADTTNAAGAGGAGYTSGGSGGIGERAAGTFPPSGPRGGGGGGGSTGLLIGSTLELVAAGGGGAGGGAADVPLGGRVGGRGGDAAGAAGTGSAGSSGDSGGPFGTPAGTGGGLGSELGDGSGGAGQFNPFAGQLNAGGGGGGGGAPNVGGGGGGTGTGNVDYGASAGGGGGGRSLTGGADVKAVKFTDTSGWRSQGNAQTSNPSRLDQDGLIVITPVFCQCSPPTLQVAAPDGRVGAAYSGTVVAGGSPTPSVSVTEGSMPPGLHLDTGGTGNIVGTPTKGGTYHFDLTADNGISPRATVHVVINVTAPPTVSGTPLDGAVGSPYGPYTFQRTGTPLPTITVHGGTFAPGLHLSSDGTVTGTPTTAGTFDFTIQASNGNAFPPDIEDEQIVISAVSPSPPTSVHATAGVESATVTWTAPTADGGSQVLRYTIVGKDLTHPANGPVTTTVTGGPPATTTVVPGLTAGDQWVFTVTATNVDQLNSPESGPSNPVVPLAPTGCAGDSAHIAPGAMVTITFSCTGPGLTYARNGTVPFHGSVGAISGNHITYTATPGFSGIDSFQVQASGPGGTATDPITIFIGAQAQTTPASDVTRASATLNGWVQSPGDHVDYSFQWGTSTSYGKTTATQTANSAGGDKIFVHAAIGGLTAGVVYHYRIHAIDPSTGNDEFGGDRLFLALPPHSVEINEVKFGELAAANAFGDDYVDIYNGSGVPVNLGNFSLLEARSRNDFGYTDLLNNVILQPRQHYLLTHRGYLLGSYAAPDQPLNSQTVGETSAFQLVGPGGTVFDSVGYTDEPYVDGRGLRRLLNFNNSNPPQLAFVRRYKAGEPVNTADNASDFLLVTANGNTYSAGGVLGSPAPLDVGSPSQVNEIAQSFLYDPNVGQGAAPNFQYIPPASGDVATNNPGTMIVRRTVTNVSTSQAITRLQLHITGLSTFGMQFDPTYGQPSNPAAMAIIEDVNATASQAGTGVIPATVNTVAHGMNSTLTIPLPTLAGSPTGKGLAPGQSISLALVFHVYSHGKYAFAYNLEDDLHAYRRPLALPTPRKPAASRTITGAAQTTSPATTAGKAPVVAGGLRGIISTRGARVTARSAAGGAAPRRLVQAFTRRARSARAAQHKLITHTTRGRHAR